MPNIDGNYVAKQCISRHYAQDPHAIADTRHRAYDKAGCELISKLPLDKPVMVKVSESQHVDYEMQQIEIAVHVELRQCQTMQVTLRDYKPDPIVRYVERAPKPKTWWETWVAPLFEEVKYDGPTGRE